GRNANVHASDVDAGTQFDSDPASRVLRMATRGGASGGGGGGGGDEHIGGDSASRALRMATLGGATALGMNTHVGSIEVGKFANLVCIDLDTLACQAAARRPADAIVFGATRDQVTDVWTSGRAAVSDGHLLTFDEQELLALAQRWAGRIPTGGAS
ncbi:MAG TPA: amidohydrolase family protein, partial [Polyangiaceae bacterium]|nr:amidohydrolase family protein [Polyangiaceae bacterium]